MNTVLIDSTDIIIAGLLLLAGSALSVVLSLQLHKDLLISGFRLIAQLLLIGLVLRFVFEAHNIALTFGYMLFMFLAATWEAGARQGRPYAPFWRYGVGGVAIGLAAVPVAMIGLSRIAETGDWFGPAHAIPMLGIVLGTAMNATSISVNHLIEDAQQRRAEIEARLALGQTRYEAMGPLVRHAVRIGMIPTINQMAGAGIISIPGIMTGQILAGMDPFEAAKYQIFLMLLLAGAGVAGTLIAVYLGVWRLMDQRHRLRLDRLIA